MFPFRARIALAVAYMLPLLASSTCVSHDLIKCINDASGFWPKCDASQSKSVPFPPLHGRTAEDYGFFCTEEWANGLNAMLSSTAVNKCSDRDAQIKLLAEVAVETGYFSTLSQPSDGGAGLIHMIPNNWEINAADMEELFPGGGFVQRVQEKGAEFFQSPSDGWLSVAAWYKSTNRVIPGCGLDLFDAAFATQTRCIFGSDDDRSEALGIVSNCFDAALTTTGMQQTTSTAFLASTPTTTTTSMASAPNDACKTCSSCVSIPENSQAATDAHCSPCAFDGQSWWPCNIEGLCQCAGGPPLAFTTTTATVMVTSPPGENCQTCSTCVSVPGNPQGAMDAHCSPCALDGQSWWPCNIEGLCQCAGR